MKLETRIRAERKTIETVCDLRRAYNLRQLSGDALTDALQRLAADYRRAVGGECSAFIAAMLRRASVAPGAPDLDFGFISTAWIENTRTGRLPDAWTL